MINPKPWGLEEEIVNAEFCGKRLLAREQHRSSLHVHRKKDEVLYVTDGLVWMEAGEDPDKLVGTWMTEQNKVRIRPGLWHRFSAINGDAVIFEFSTHHDEKDSERRQAGGRMEEAEYGGLQASFVKSMISRPVIDLEEARALAEALHAEGHVIGMVNGCFDLLHVGHVELFKQAKGRCETLFVAVNGDESIRRIKGPRRPFVPEEARFLLVAFNKFVDYVVPFREDDCLEVVRAIRPDVYVTTTECAEKSPEARETRKLGGKVEVIQMLPGFSTTKIAEEIAGKKQGDRG